MTATFLCPAPALLRHLWGDRGAGVLARDNEMCERLVEQRRSLPERCMTFRGWLVRSE
jgi:hypothetical protein